MSSTLLLDDFDVARFTALAARLPSDSFRYAVTPNADHLIRLHDDPHFRASYDEADYVLFDSRFLAHLLRLTRRVNIPVCTGSDVTATLFSKVIKSDDPVVLIGGSPEQARIIASRYRLRNLSHHNPSMGFIEDPAAVEECLKFIEEHSPFRFCFLCIGVPRQEAIAQRLKARGKARGLALCVGASINFLTGAEHRAPVWMQRSGLEWLHRLAQAPRRMAKRYLVRGPRVFGVLLRTRIELRLNWSHISVDTIRAAFHLMLFGIGVTNDAPMPLDELLKQWRATGLRKSDLLACLELFHEEKRLGMSRTPLGLTVSLSQSAVDSSSRTTQQDTLLLQQARRRVRSGFSRVERRRPYLQSSRAGQHEPIAG